MGGLWSVVHHKRSVINIGFGKGINSYNDPLDLANDELTDSWNMCADDYPIIRTRNDRVLSSLPQSVGTLWGIGQRAQNELHVLEGNTWKYGSHGSTAWTNISTAIPSPADPSFVEFNTQTDKYTIMAYSTGAVYNGYWDGSVYSTFGDTNAPKSNLYISHKNRLYGVANDGRTLRYCAQGDITDWTLANDAGYLDITEAQGKITAVTGFADHPILWTDNSMHEVYGSAYDNYQLVNVSRKIGCVSRHAYVESGGRLFWLDYSGIYMYTGGLPRQIAHKANGILDGINWNYKNLIRAGAVGDKIYFSIPYQSTANNMQLVIDMVEEKRKAAYTVNKEEGNWMGYANNSEKLYGLRSDGYVYDMNSTYKTGLDNSTAISWYLETKPFHDEINLESAVRDMWLQHSGTTLATMAVGFTTNDNSTTFTALAASSDFRHTEYSVRKVIHPSPVQLQGMGFMKFRLSGTGYKKISGLMINLISYGDVI